DALGRHVERQPDRIAFSPTPPDVGITAVHQRTDIDRGTTDFKPRGTAPGRNPQTQREIRLPIRIDSDLDRAVPRILRHLAQLDVRSADRRSAPSRDIEMNRRLVPTSRIDVLAERCDEPADVRWTAGTAMPRPAPMRAAACKRVVVEEMLAVEREAA